PAGTRRSGRPRSPAPGTPPRAGAGSPRPGSPSPLREASSCRRGASPAPGRAARSSARCSHGARCSWSPEGSCEALRQIPPRPSLGQRRHRLRGQVLNGASRLQRKSEGQDLSDPGTPQKTSGDGQGPAAVDPVIHEEDGATPEVIEADTQLRVDLEAVPHPREPEGAVAARLPGGPPVTQRECSQVRELPRSGEALGDRCRPLGEAP